MCPQGAEANGGLLASILGEWPVGALPPCSSDGALILRVDGCGNRLAVNFIGGNVSYVSTSEVTRIVGREADQGHTYNQN